MNKPIFHITPKKGWMNDPNGLVEYKGAYHVFYQADPNHLINKTIGWGHKMSYDLLHWEECLPALLPDADYDRDGCFTGSAVVKDDKMYLLYTGHVNQENGYVETQNLAVSEDGIHFEKYEGNPVIEKPPIDTTMRFRDPKIWEANGRYYVAIGAESEDKCGKVVYYVSDDLYNYEYCGILANSDGSIGNMWECPNFTKIESTDVLIFSPKGLGKHFPVSFESGYMTGTMDYVNEKFEHGPYHTLDHGFDFYAPQVMECGNRKILFAWFAIPDSIGKEMEDGWRHLLTLPRELKISSDNRLLMMPIKELEELRTGLLTQTRLNELWECDVENQPLELLFTGSHKEVCLKIEDEKEQLLEFTVKNDCITLKQKREEGWEERTCSYEDDAVEKMQIYMDYNTFEVFINDGRYVFSCRIYPGEKLHFAMDGATNEIGGKLKMYSLSL